MRRLAPILMRTNNHVCTLLIWVPWFLTCLQLTYMFYDCLDCASYNCIVCSIVRVYKSYASVLAWFLQGESTPSIATSRSNPKKSVLGCSKKPLQGDQSKNMGRSRTLLRSKWRFGFHHVENLIFHVVHRGNVRTCHRGYIQRIPLEIPQWAFWLQKLDDCSEEVVDDKSIYPLAQTRIGIGFGWNRSKTLSSQHHARCQVIMKPCLRAAKYKSPHIRPYCRPHTCLKTTISILHCQKHIAFLKGSMALCFKYRVCNPSYDQRILKNTSRCASKSIQSINNWARHNRCDECLKASRSIELPETLRADCKSLTRKNALKYSN